MNLVFVDTVGLLITLRNWYSQIAADRTRQMLLNLVVARNSFLATGPRVDPDGVIAALSKRNATILPKVG